MAFRADSLLEDREPSGFTNYSSGLKRGQATVAWDHTFLFFFFFLNLFIYLFMAALGLRFCARAFSSCGKRGPLTIAASLVAEHRLQTRRLSNCGSRA